MSPKRVLVVEDDSALRSIIRDNLTREGLTVLEAKTGKDALKQALTERPDLILLDIILPDMDGIKVLKEIHADSWGKTAKVIMLTNLSDNKSVASSLEFGSYDFIVKSDWKIEDVMKLVRDKLKD